MDIVILGANGRTGRAIIDQALAAGHSLTALVRAEGTLADMHHKGLTVQVGDPCDAQVLKKILPGHDAVISALGPRKPTKAACTIYSQSAIALKEAMHSTGVNRLLLVSTALLFPPQGALDRLLRWVAHNNSRAARRMEDTITTSTLDWTIARVGFLNNSDAKEYRSQQQSLPHHGGGISRAALAHFLLTEAREPQYVRQVVGLSGGLG